MGKSKAFSEVDYLFFQLNGAELACGTAIHVEPASHDYKSKVNSQRISVSDCPLEDVPPVDQSHKNEPTVAKEEVETGGDLDDFFASLE